MTQDNPNGEQLSSSSFDLPSGLYQDTKVVSDFKHTNLMSAAYILAIATVRRDLENVSEPSRSHVRHKRIVDESIVTVDGIDRLSILVDLDVKHRVLLRDSFSETQHWGRLHDFYVEVIGSQSVAYGVAALLGRLFRQDAIGITHPLTKDDHRTLHLNQGPSLPKDFHSYFTAQPISPISRDTAIEAMKHVCQCFPNISAQLDTSGKSIEFHDFSSSSNCTSEGIEKILNANLNQTFQVSTGFAKSSLMTKNDYRQALCKLGYEMSRMVDWEKLICKHKMSFIWQDFQ